MRECRKDEPEVLILATSYLNIKKIDGSVVSSIDVSDMQTCEDLGAKFRSPMAVWAFVGARIVCTWCASSSSRMGG